MNFLHARVNDAVRDNPPTANGRTADIHITERGSDVGLEVTTLSQPMLTQIVLLCSLRLYG